jgi:hypothetical protein
MCCAMLDRGHFDCHKRQSAVMTGDALCLPQRNLFYASVKEAHAFLIPLLRFIGLELGAKNVTGEPTFASPLASKEHTAHRHAGRLLKAHTRRRQ